MPSTASSPQFRAGTGAPEGTELFGVSPPPPPPNQGQPNALLLPAPSTSEGGELPPRTGARGQGAPGDALGRGGRGRSHFADLQSRRRPLWRRSQSLGRKESRVSPDISHRRGGDKRASVRGPGQPPPRHGSVPGALGGPRRSAPFASGRAGVQPGTPHPALHLPPSWVPDPPRVPHGSLYCSSVLSSPRPLAWARPRLCLIPTARRMSASDPLRSLCRTPSGGTSLSPPVASLCDHFLSPQGPRLLPRASGLGQTALLPSPSPHWVLVPRWPDTTREHSGDFSPEKR